MQALEYNHEDFRKQNQREADKALAVRFFYKPRQDEAATLAQGRPIFKDVLYIQIDTPGNRLGGVCRPCSQQDISRFREGYDAFMKRTTESPELVGTPLSEWPQITRSQAEELSFFHVKTVEQLANMSDGNGSQFMGFYGLREKAKAWLDAAKDQNAATKLQAELAKRDAVIAELSARLDALTGAESGSITPITAAPCAPKKKGGRPRKIRPEEVPTTQ